MSARITAPYVSGSFCVHCGNDTSPGSGRFVNRIPAVVDVAGTFFESSIGESFTEIEGWMCPECQEEPDTHSADFGELWLVRVTYNTDFDGRPVDVATELVIPQTLHGPFDTIELAADWRDSYPDDPDVAEVDLVPLNKVRP